VDESVLLYDHLSSPFIFVACPTAKSTCSNSNLNLNFASHTLCSLNVVQVAVYMHAWHTARVGGRMSTY